MAVGHTIQIHDPSGELFALAYDGDVIVQCGGPIPFQDVVEAVRDGETIEQIAEGLLSGLTGGAGEDDAEWARLQAWHPPLTAETVMETLRDERTDMRLHADLDEGRA